MELVTAFDVDRTLINGATVAGAVVGLAAAGALTRHNDKLAELNAFRNSDNPAWGLDYIRAIDESYYELVYDVPEDIINEVAATVAEHWASVIFPEMEPELEAARKRGKILLVSAGPRLFIEAFGRHKAIGAAASIGRSLEDYRGKVKPTKDDQIRAVAQSIGLTFGENGNAQVDHAYGDSHADFPMLHMARHPVVVNPLNEQVENYRQEQGWREPIWCKGLLPFGDLDQPLVLADDYKRFSS